MKKHNYRWPVIYSILLTSYTIFTVLDVFVIPHATIKLSSVTSSSVASGTSSGTDSEALSSSENNASSSKSASGGATWYNSTGSTVSSSKTNTTSASSVSSSTSTSDSKSASNSTSSSSGNVTETDDGWIYKSDDVTITITKKSTDDTEVYIADVQITDASLLQSGVANGTLGRNITEKTSEIAKEVNAILAINGDFYGFRDTGYVVRNGYLYRDTKSSDDTEDLVVYSDGTMGIIKEGDISASELVKKGAVQVYSFGPGLISNGEIAVDENSEVDQSMTSNPRTAIGYYSALHYCFVVSDGRTSESAGLSLYQLATLMKNLGCTTAYNLDGGGSSTMYFNGNVINKPTTNGNNISERSVSDIVYIGE